MQYGVDVTTYKRVGDKRKDKKEIKIMGSPYRLLFDFFGAFLISRVTINASGAGIDGLAPFGIAFILSFLNREEKKRRHNCFSWCFTWVCYSLGQCA